MNTLNIEFEGAVLPSDLADVTKPIGKATQIWYRALQANGVTPTAFKVNGKTVAIDELVGANHA
jgi:hypothetical protein